MSSWGRSGTGVVSVGGRTEGTGTCVSCAGLRSDTCCESAGESLTLAGEASVAWSDSSLC